MSIHLIWLQHVRRDAARRARLSSTANPYGSFLRTPTCDQQTDGTAAYTTLA